MNFKIEKKGWVYIALCFIITASAANTTNNSLYLLSAFMLSLFLFSGVFSSLNMFFLRIERVEIGEIYAKVNGFLVLKLKKSKFFPLCLKAGNHRLTIRNDEILYPVFFEKRGLYKLPQIKIESSFPFGFINRYKIFNFDEYLLVYPFCGRFENPGFKLRKTEGEEEEKKNFGEIKEFYGIRLYQEGDDPRHIHWKKSAQRRELIVKEFETKSKGNMQLFLDTHIKDEKKFEEEVEKVASWCCRLLFEGKRVSLMTWEFFIPEGSGEGQRKKILSFLSFVKND